MKGACPSTTRMSRAIQGGELSAAHMWGVRAMLRTKPSEHQPRCCSRHTALLGEAVGTRDRLLAGSEHSVLTATLPARPRPVHALRGTRRRPSGLSRSTSRLRPGRTGGAPTGEERRLLLLAVGMLTAHTARAVAGTHCDF